MTSIFDCGCSSENGCKGLPSCSEICCRLRMHLNSRQPGADSCLNEPLWLMIIMGPCPSLTGRKLKCHVCAHRKRTGIIGFNTTYDSCCRDVGRWPLCDPVTSSWPRTDSIVTSCWPFLTLLCEQCGPAHSATQSNEEVYLSWPVGEVFGEQRDQAHFDPRPSILSPYPPHLLWVWISSTCDLYTWPVSLQLSWLLWSYFDESHDHASAWRAAIEAPRCHVRNTETLGPYPHSYLCLSGESMKKTKSSWNIFNFYIHDVAFAALKPEKGFSFTWISCFLWPRLELIEDQYKQSTHAVNTHSNLSPCLWTGSLL